MTAVPTVGATVRARTLTDLHGREVRLPGSRITHLHFARFAGCPICDLRLKGFVAAADQIDAAGIDAVVVFHSTVAELLAYEDGLPFATIPDPERRLYAEFGVGRAWSSLLHPRAMGDAGRGLGAALRRRARGEAPGPPLRPSGGQHGLPADFLIGPDGAVLAALHGRHAADSWSVPEVLELATGGAR